jgi:hypothetical protein
LPFSSPLANESLLEGPSGVNEKSTDLLGFETDGPGTCEGR